MKVGEFILYPYQNDAYNLAYKAGEISSIPIHHDAHLDKAPIGIGYFNHYHKGNKADAHAMYGVPKFRWS
jgi:hypothetical protein